MNRSLNLLRPLGARRFASASVKPTALPLPRTAVSLGLSPFGLRRYASSVGKSGQEGVKSGSSGSAEKPKANPHADQQNATSSAMEEVKGTARDFASMIGGGGQYQSLAMETSSHGHGGSIKEDFYNVTKGMVSDVPKSALFFGGAGLIPYIGTAAATVGLAREAAIAADGTDQAALDNALSLLHTMEHIQISYGVAILSFLGAIHWGFEFAKTGGEQGWKRLAIGVGPVLLAWPTVFLTHGVALAAQWAGFTGLWFLDQKATSKGWTTAWYSTYRFYLSIVVGFSIIATLAGTSYYGAGAGAVNQTRIKKTQHTTMRQSPVARLDRVKEKNKEGSSGKLEGKVAGDMQVDERDDGEGYLKLRNIAHEEEEAEEKKQEAEQKKKEEQEAKKVKQDKKDEGQMDKAPGDMKDSAKDRTGKNKNVKGGEEKADDEKTAGMEDAVDKHNKDSE